MGAGVRVEVKRLGIAVLIGHMGRHEPGRVQVAQQVRGILHAQGRKHVGLHIVLERLAGHLGDHIAQDIEAGIAVGPVLTGPEGQGLVAEAADVVIQGSLSFRKFLS